MAHRAEHAGCAQRLASQARAPTQLQDQAAHAQAQLVSCKVELADLGALHQRELHAKDGLIARLKAALAAEEAARASAAQQLSAAQQEKARLRVSMLVVAWLLWGSMRGASVKSCDWCSHRRAWQLPGQDRRN